MVLWISQGGELMESKALEVNLACTRVDVTVDNRYEILLDVMEPYYGVRLALETFLKEICHPFRNWQYIVKETRSFALNYFHVLNTHPKGAEAAQLYFDIFFQAMDDAHDPDVRRDAADNLLLLAQHMIQESGDAGAKWLPVLDTVFDRIRESPEDVFFLFVTSYYQLSGLGKRYARSFPPEVASTSLNRLLDRYFRFTYHYWLGQEDPVAWFEQESGEPVQEEKWSPILTPISHRQLEVYLNELEDMLESADAGSRSCLSRLLELPGYGEIVSHYEAMPNGLLRAVADTERAKQWKLLGLLHIMNVSGLSSIHEETLRQINRTFADIIEDEAYPVIQQFLEKIFAMLRQSVEKFPSTALNCVLNIGRGVYKTDESELVDFFIDGVVSLGFQAPDIVGVGADWQIRANAAHIQNIRTWVELIELSPKWSKKLLSSLIIHLSLGGVLIKDTDLFPRDITQLLNSDIGPVYNLVKQLGRLLPAFFSDIGAEGVLRDISTRIDEICHRKDPLSHFLRKQSHVESSNQIITLSEQVLSFWKTGNKEGLKPLLPANIYEQIETAGPYIDGVHRIVRRLFEREGLSHIDDLLNLDKDRLKEGADRVPGSSLLDWERVELMVELYKLLYQKYSLRFVEIDGYLAGLRSSGLPDTGYLRSALGSGDIREQIRGLSVYLEQLREIILSPERYEAREDIYRKRHFAVDIPSMYGSYHELKFEALGLSFRLESLLTARLEDLVEEMDFKLITKATFYQVHEDLHLFDRTCWPLLLRCGGFPVPSTSIFFAGFHRLWETW